MRSTKIKWHRIISIILVLLLFLFCIMQNNVEKVEEHNDVSGTLEVHFIDVGQADCTLVMQDDKVMLVDSGTIYTSNNVVEYLKDLNITKIDVLIATHQHQDHIGGMEKIKENFEIGVIYMPNLKYEKISTQSYNSFISSVEKWSKQEGNDVLFAKDENGELREFKLGEANVRFLAPNSNWYITKNNYSIVTKITFGQTNVLLAADAEIISELEMILSETELKSDILKVGHHGSNSSTTKMFLKSVDPNYAVISVGKDNDYGYPTTRVIDKLNKMDINIYRTDKLGTIIMVTDGKNINFTTKPVNYNHSKCN